MNESTHLLADRIQAIEIHLESHHGPDLVSQLVAARLAVQKSLQHEPDLQSLHQMIDKLELWGMLRREHDTTESTAKEPEDKELLILAKHMSIQETYDVMSRVDAMDVSSLINYVAKSSDKTHNLFEDLSMIVKYREEVKQLTLCFDMMVLKSMIVLERHVKLLIEKSEFRSHVEQRLRELQRQSATRKKQVEEQNRY
jgi:hypothetical protein